MSDEPEVAMAEDGLQEVFPDAEEIDTHTRVIGFLHQVNALEIRRPPDAKITKPALILSDGANAHKEKKLEPHERAAIDAQINDLIERNKPTK